MRLAVSIIPPAPLAGSKTDDEPTAKPLVKIVVPVDPHETFEDLWRIVAQRYTRRSFSEKKRPEDVYFSKFTDVLGADIFTGDTVGSLFPEDTPIQDLQLNLILHETWRQDTIPLDSEFRPRGFKPPTWEDLTPEQQEKVLRRQSEEGRYGRSLDQLDADFPITSREPTDGPGEAAAETVDTDGFRIPTRPVKTSVQPIADATQTHYSSPRTAKTPVLSSSTSPENDRRNSSAVNPCGSEERPRVRAALAPQVAKRHSAGPPTPISNEASASSQVPPPSAQRPSSNPAPPTEPRSSYQRHGSSGGHRLDMKTTDPVQDDSEDDDSDEYGPAVHLDDATLQHIDSLSQEHQARLQQSKLGGNLRAVGSSHPQSQAAIQTSSQSSPPNVSPKASQNSAFDQMLQSSQPAPPTRKRPRDPNWSESEDKILLEHPGLSSSKFARLLPRRSDSSIRNRRRDLRKAAKVAMSAGKQSREPESPKAALGGISATQLSTSAAPSAAPSSQSMSQTEVVSPLAPRLAEMTQKPRPDVAKAVKPPQSVLPHVETTKALSPPVIAASVLRPGSTPPLPLDIFAVPVSQPARPEDAAPSSCEATRLPDPPGAQLARELSASASSESRARVGSPRLQCPPSPVGKLPTRNPGKLTAVLAGLCPPAKRLKPAVSSQPSQKRIMDYLTADDGAPPAKKLRTGRRHAATSDAVEGPVLMSGGRSPGPSPSRIVEEVQVPSSGPRSTGSQPSKLKSSAHEEPVLETQIIVISDDPSSNESSADDRAPLKAQPDQDLANASMVVLKADALQASFVTHRAPSRSPLRPQHPAAKISTESPILPREMPAINTIRPSPKVEHSRPFIKRTMAQYREMVKVAFKDRPEDRRTVEMVLDDLRTDDDMLNAVYRGDKEEIARLKTLRRRRKRERRELWGLPAKQRRQPAESLAAVGEGKDVDDDDVEEVVREDDFTSEDESLSSLYSGLEDDGSEAADDDDDDDADDIAHVAGPVCDRHISEVDDEDDVDESLVAPDNGASRLGLVDGAIDAGVTKQEPLLSLHGPYKRVAQDKLATAKKSPTKAPIRPESSIKAEPIGFQSLRGLRPGGIPAPQSCSESIAGSEASSGLGSITSRNKRAKRRRERAKVQDADEADKPDVARPPVFKKPALPAKIRPGPATTREQKSATVKTEFGPAPSGPGAYKNAFGIDTRQFNLPSPIRRVAARPSIPGARRTFPYESDDESIYSTPRSTGSRRV